MNFDGLTFLTALDWCCFSYWDMRWKVEKASFI